MAAGCWLGQFENSRDQLPATLDEYLGASYKFSEYPLEFFTTEYGAAVDCIKAIARMQSCQVSR
jgi:hypothetical protein